MLSKYNKKLNLVINIDETLLYFIANPHIKRIWTNLPDIEKNKYKSNIKVFTDNHIIIFRPYLEKFLKFIFKNFEVTLWSNKNHDYMEDIINEYIIKYGIPKYILGEKQTNIAKELHGNFKDLNLLWYGNDRTYSNSIPKIYSNFNESNTILIDNLQEITLNSSNIDNSITIKEFNIFKENKYFDLSNDKILLELINLLKILLLTKKKLTLSNIDNIFYDNNIKLINNFCIKNSINITKYIKEIKFKKKKKNIFFIESNLDQQGGNNKLISSSLLTLLVLAGSL